MTKWGVLTRFTPYEVFDTKAEAVEYATVLGAYTGIHGFVVEDECP